MRCPSLLWEWLTSGAAEEGVTITTSRTAETVREDVETAALEIRITLEEADRFIAEANEFVARLPLLEFVQLTKFTGVEAREVNGGPGVSTTKNCFVRIQVLGSKGYAPITGAGELSRIAFASCLPELMERLNTALWRRSKLYDDALWERRRTRR